MSGGLSPEMTDTGLSSEPGGSQALIRRSSLMQHAKPILNQLVQEGLNVLNNSPRYLNFTLCDQACRQQRACLNLVRHYHE